MRQLATVDGVGQMIGTLATTWRAQQMGQ
jgi:hypothetical protein